MAPHPTMTTQTVIEGLTSAELEVVAVINSLEVDADRPEGEASDIRWEQARQVVEALDTMTQQKIADNWKRADGSSYSQQHVSFVKKTWDYYLSSNDKPRWNEAYNSDEVRKPSKAESDPVEPGPLPEGAFRTIVADPPWQYGNKATRGAAEDHYSTMTVENICELEVNAADDAHLYLWTTNGFLNESFDVVKAWGFTYKTCLTWVKPQIGLGNYFRSSTEHILFGVRGKLPIEDRTLRNWFEAPRGKHSAKPDSFYDLVEKASPGPYLEMFARRRRFGWESWGDEA